MSDEIRYDPSHSGTICSMTGYASTRFDIGESNACVLTLKSVNHRFLDVALRLPPNCDALEGAVRKILKAHLRRGHVELTLELDRPLRSAVTFNEASVATYVRAFRLMAAANKLASEPNLNDVLRMPGMMGAPQTAARDDSPAIEAAVLEHLPALLASFNAVRGLEGAALAIELHASMGRIDALAQQVSALREGARGAAFERLRERVTELTRSASVISASGIEDRLLAEAALLVGRADVEEELVRLRTHAGRFIELLDQGGELGKRLDFLLQELNREANTLLSKTGGADAQNGLRITELGLEIKLEIERAREQVQNLE